MSPVALRKGLRNLVLAALLFPCGASLAAPQAVAVLTFEYQQSERKWINDGQSLFGRYLGTGDGVASGALQGTVGWDLYEDQSRDDLHPAVFRGFVERAGKRHAFQIIGVYTPDGPEQARNAADNTRQPRHWILSGTIVFEDDELLGVRQGLVTGRADTGAGILRQTVWVDHEKR